VTVGALTEERNKKFVRDGLKAGHAISYIARNLGVIAAAIRHAKLPCHLIYGEASILAKWPEFQPKPARQVFEPTDQELARLLRAPMPKMLRRWLMLAMATGGRPEALLDLAPAARKRELGLIDLNPEGRRQNKKYRATVREIPSLTKLLGQWEREDAAERKKRKKMPLNYCRYASVDSLDTALHRLRAREDVNLPTFSSYSLRHRVASVLRASKSPRVPGEQISYQMGHRRVSHKGEARTTRGYGQFDADYLAEAALVLDGWMSKVLRLAQGKQDRKLQQAA
jgi:integrase